MNFEPVFYPIRNFQFKRLSQNEIISAKFPYLYEELKFCAKIMNGYLMEEILIQKSIWVSFSQAAE